MFKPALALAALAAMTVTAAPTVARERLTGEQELAKLLKGRVAGKPKNCINTRVNQSQRVIDKTAVVYGSGRTIWVNVPHNAEDLDDRDAMVVRMHGTQLCRQDIVTTLDTGSRMYSGNVFLGDFVPYTRVD
ncbi:hypothetical protein ACWPM1_00315 [Tsuneonella sp. HG249]